MAAGAVVDGALDFIRSLVHGRGRRRPVFLKFRSSTAFIATVVCIAVFTDIFLYGVIVPVIPFAINVRAGVPTENVQHWVSVLLAVYGASLLVVAPICGVLADRYGSRQVPLLLGLVVLAGATMMLCFGRSIALLVVGRLLQGGSAAVVWTVAMALLVDTTGEKDSGLMMGYVAVSYSLGVLVAPLLGGAVYSRGGYYAVFAMTFGVIGVDIVLRLLVVEKKVARRWLLDADQGERREERARMDLRGETGQDQEGQQPDVELQSMTTMSIPPVSPTAAEIEKQQQQQQQQQRSTANVAVASQQQGVERRKKKKLPAILTLLKSKRILAAFWGNFVVSASMSAFDTTLPLYCHRIFGWDSLGAGLIFIPLFVPSFLGPVIGYCVDRWGCKWIAATGLMLSLPFWVLLRLVDHDTVKQIVLLCALLALMGMAAALPLTSLMSEFSKVCDVKVRQDPDLFGGRSAYAQAYGIFNVAWATGSLVGPLWAAAVEKHAGWKTMTWTLGLLNGVSAIPILIYSGGLITRRKGARNSGDVSDNLTVSAFN